MKHLVLLIVAETFFFVGSAQGAELTNDRYRIVAEADHSLTLSVAGMPAVALRPEFVVVVNEKDPGYTRYSSHPNYPIAPRVAIRWRANSESIADVRRWLQSDEYLDAAVLGNVEETDGGWIWQYHDAKGKPTIKVVGPRARETTRPFAAGKPVRVRVVAASLTDDRTIRWKFADEEAFDFAAEVRLPPADADPVVHFTLTPKTEAYYGVLFVGMPEVPYAATLPVPQETMQRAHKLFNYVLCESDLHLPRAHVATSEGNFALVADPAESPFRLPNHTDSRFGLMLRREAGRLQPVLMAPLLGGAESRRKPGEAYSFAMRAVVRPGNWKETFRHIAQNIYEVHDERDATGPGSLNGTIGRIMDFLSDRDGRNRAFWHDEQKYFDYYVDQSNVFKPFSPLFGLSAAIVTDDEDFYRRRARPTVEFALSRKYNLFAPYEGVSYSNIGSANNAVGGPFIGYAQLLALDELLQRRSSVVAALAEEKGPDDGSLADLLATWRRTGDTAVLDDVKQRAASMIDRGAVSSEAAFFDLLELYDAAPDERVRQGVVDAAYHRLTTVNMFPRTPDTTVVADAGGRVPIHFHSFGRHKNVWGFPPPVPLRTIEKDVPAWRLSRVGVPSIAYPMEYWMNYHAGLMRAAAIGDDRLLRDVAHNGMIGRYGHFPGDNRSQPSLVGEWRDTPERPPWEWNFTTMNPCHAWDFVAWLIDFLVSDVYERSNRAITFPSETTAGSNFRCRVYGARPGKFYGDENVRLWLPRGLVEYKNDQLDWLGGYGNGRFYFALWNQSAVVQRVAVRINTDFVELRGAHRARTWTDNRKADDTEVTDGWFDAVVPAKGIVALAVDDAVIKTRWHHDLYDEQTPPLGPQSFFTMPTSFGTVRAMTLSGGRGLTSVYIYADTPSESVITAKLWWRQGTGEWRETTDEIYPFEFSFDVDHNNVEAVFEIENIRGEIERSKPIVLKHTITAGTSNKSTRRSAAEPAPKVERLEGNWQPGDEFVAYMQTAANPKGIGFTDDGRCRPYATPLGRRIGWRQPVVDKGWYVDGWSKIEAERALRNDLQQAAAAARTFCAERTPQSFDDLPREKQEMLVDFFYAEPTDEVRIELIDAVLSGDWKRLIDECLYVRYYGPSPDQPRNKAFADRWIYSEKLIPLRKTP